MKPNLLLGVICTILATIFYSTLTTINKVYAGSLPVSVMVFTQSAVGFFLFLPFVFKKGVTHARKVVISKRIPLHILRSILSLGVGYFLFAAVKFIPLTNAMLLANTAPIILPFLAYFFLKQKINHNIWLPVIVGFLGVAIILHPDGRIFNPASLLALGSAMSIASTMLVIRRLVVTESSETIMFYFFLFSMLISGVFAIYMWVPLTPHLWLVLGVSGTCYFISQYIMTYALKFANAQLVGSLMFMNVVNAVVISAFIWHVLPSALTGIGIMLTVIGSILCIRVEHHRNKHRQASLKKGVVYVEQS